MTIPLALNATTLSSMNLLALAAADTSTSLLTDTAPDLDTGAPSLTTSSDVADAGQQLRGLTELSGAVTDDVPLEEPLSAEVVDSTPLEDTARMSPAAAVMMVAALATLAVVSLPGEAFAQDRVMEKGARIVGDTDQFIDNLRDLWWLAVLYGIPVARTVVRKIRGTLSHAYGVFKPPARKKPPSLPPGAPGRKPKEPAEASAAPTWKPSILPLEVINQTTGWWEMKVGPVRDFVAPWWAVISSAITFAINPAAPLITYAPQAAALGLSLYLKGDRTLNIDAPLYEQIEAAGRPLTATAFDYHQDRLSGILAPRPPEGFREDELYEFGHKYYEGEPRRSVLRSIMGVQDTMRFAASLVHQSRAKAGFWEFQTLLWRFRYYGEVAAPNPEFLDLANRIARQWAIQHAHRCRSNISIDTTGLKGIPLDAPRIWTGNHDSIWPNFYGAFILTHEGKHFAIRPMADINNFATSKILRPFKLPVGLMLLGLPFVGRGDQSGFDWEKDLRVKNDMGIEALMYAEGGRRPRAYLENGDPDIPGVYMIITSKTNPRYFLRPGLARAATGLARRKGETVYIPFIRQDGGYRVAPKVGSIPPFIQRIRTNQDIYFDYPEVVRITPETSREEAQQRIEEMYIRADGINELLQERFAAWARDYNPTQAELLIQRFQERATDDVGYYIVADRIRGIPPSDPRRRRFQDRLYAFLLEDEHKEDHFVDLMQAVSRHLKRVEYS